MFTTKRDQTSNDSLEKAPSSWLRLWRVWRWLRSGLRPPAAPCTQPRLWCRCRCWDVLRSAWESAWKPVHHPSSWGRNNTFIILELRSWDLITQEVVWVWSSTCSADVCRPARVSRLIKCISTLYIFQTLICLQPHYQTGRLRTAAALTTIQNILKHTETNPKQLGTFICALHGRLSHFHSNGLNDFTLQTPQNHFTNLRLQPCGLLMELNSWEQPSSSRLILITPAYLLFMHRAIRRNAFKNPHLTLPHPDLHPPTRPFKPIVSTSVSVHRKPVHVNLLQSVDEPPVVDGWRVDDLLDELPVTVGVGRGDVEEDLQLLHPVGQGQHLLCGQDVQLHRISEGQINH